MGTIYQISRSIGSSNNFQVIGISGTKSFTDETLPAGTASVFYRIRAIRSTKVGPAATFMVNLGVAGGECASRA